MKVSGFTIVRNGVKLKYPMIPSIQSILPICDEFIVNVGDSDDGTLDTIKSIASPKIKIIENQWDMSQGPAVLAQQTNIALHHCSGDWAFYLQTDEVIHEADLPKIKQCMADTCISRKSMPCGLNGFIFTAAIGVTASTRAGIKNRTVSSVIMARSNLMVMRLLFTVQTVSHWCRKYRFFCVSLRMGV